MLQLRSWRLGFAVLLGLSLACGSGALRGGDSSADSTDSALVGSVILNEVLANEPGSDTTKEFVEVVNTGSSAVDVSGWTVSDSVSVRHTFASGTTLGAGGALVVFGSSKGIPAGLPNAVGATTGTLSLSNSGDTVTLKNAGGSTLDSVTYSSALANKDGVSMNRNPDGTGSGTWVLHTTVSALSSSPGTRADGSPFGSNPPPPHDAGTPDAGRTDAGTDGGNPPPRTDGGLHLRVVEGNISSGNNQSYDPGNGQRIFEGLHPDVTLIQEFNDGTNSDADIRAFVDSTWGTDFQYVRQSGAGIQIPNGVISRYPIVASGTWTDPEVANRGFTWAHIQLPASHDLWAISLHLLTSNGSSRASEASALVKLIQANVPAGDFLVIGGDLNTSSRGEACITTLANVVVTTAPYPADGKGNANTSENRDKPHDWVMAKANLKAFEVPVNIGGVNYPSGLVFDSRIFTPLSAVSPVQQNDSGASGMQHMAVVKDFLIQ